MTTSKSTIFRELGLAVSHASCESTAALDSAIEHVQRALDGLRELRATARPWLGVDAARKEGVR